MRIISLKNKWIAHTRFHYLYPSFFNLGTNHSFLPWTNYNEDKRSGFDFSLSANKKIGEFDVTLGFNGMVFTSEALTRDEVANEDYLLTCRSCIRR